MNDGFAASFELFRVYSCSFIPKSIVHFDLSLLLQQRQKHSWQLSEIVCGQALVLTTEGRDGRASLWEWNLGISKRRVSLSAPLSVQTHIQTIPCNRTRASPTQQSTGVFLSLDTHHKGTMLHREEEHCYGKQSLTWSLAFRLSICCCSRFWCLQDLSCVLAFSATFSSVKGWANATCCAALLLLSTAYPSEASVSCPNVKFTALRLQQSQRLVIAQKKSVSNACGIQEKGSSTQSS